MNLRLQEYLAPEECTPESIYDYAYQTTPENQEEFPAISSIISPLFADCSNQTGAVEV